MRLFRNTFRKRTPIAVALVLTLSGCQTIGGVVYTAGFFVVMAPFLPYAIATAPMYIANDSDTGVVDTAFAPDGSHMLVTYRTNNSTTFYRMGFDGENVTPVTSGEHFDFDPTYSPDGSRIAFFRRFTRRANHLYIMDADGSNLRQLTKDRREDFGLQFSPNGSLIVFPSYVLRKQADLFVVNLDTGTETRLTEDRGTHDVSPVFLPDSETILFARAQDYIDDSAQWANYWANWGLCAIPVTGGEPVAMISHIGPEGSMVRVRSDSKRFVLVYDGQFLDMDRATFDSVAAKDVKQFAFEALPEEIDEMRVYDISPDLRYLLVRMYQHSTGHYVVYTLKTRTGEFREILRFNSARPVKALKFAPDGEHVLYRVRMEAKWGRKHDALWIATLDGNHRRLDTAITTVPEWTLKGDDAQLDVWP